LFAEDFLRGIVEQSLAVHRPGHAVINGFALNRGDFDARGSHENGKEMGGILEVVNVFLTCPL
jgi:hypothetical protein